MGYTPVTPFRRTLDAVLLKHQQAQASRAVPPQGADKWEVLRELAVCRETFGLSDRDMTVLQALVSFHPGKMLGGEGSDLVVHPSNRAICERLNGMPCSTMRRHLARLVSAGMVIRRDSPNGKRYARRQGEEKVAFGFDLAPLPARFAEICEAAEAVRAAADRLKRLRETASLMRRDLASLAAFGANQRPDLNLWTGLAETAAAASAALRRKLGEEALRSVVEVLKAGLDAARECLEWADTENMSTNDVRSEQHHQTSKPDSPDLEIPKNRTEPDEGHDQKEDPEDRNLPNIPLGLVVSTCAEIQGYAERPIRHWHELVRAADVVRPMMGISPSAWDDAKREMGPEEAAVVVAAMLERFTEIHAPGGYLRHLTMKAARGAFSCGPMVMALMRRDAA